MVTEWVRQHSRILRKTRTAFLSVIALFLVMVGMTYMDAILLIVSEVMILGIFAVTGVQGLWSMGKFAYQLYRERKKVRVAEVYVVSKIA